MSTNLDLKQTEKASFKLAAYGDGLNDISLGLTWLPSASTLLPGRLWD